MISQQQPPGPSVRNAAEASASVGSARARLALIAHDVALSVPGVVRFDDARAFTTTGPSGETLTGVSCAAEASGRYSVSLRLVAELVPLHPLAKRILARMRAAAEAADLGGLLGEISVTFADIEEEGPR